MRPGLIVLLVILALSLLVAMQPSRGSSGQGGHHDGSDCLCPGQRSCGGLVGSLPHPGANVTGVSLQGLDLIGKRLHLLKEMIPGLAHVAYLRNPTEPYSAAYWREVQDAARALGVNQLLSLEARGPDEFEEAFAELARGRPDAVLVEPNALNWTYRGRIAAFGAEHRLPTMSSETGFAEGGDLMSYGLSLPDHARRAAALVEKI